MLRIPGPGVVGAGRLQLDSTGIVSAVSAQNGNFFIVAYLVSIVSIFTVFVSPRFLSPPDNVVRFNKTTSYALRNTVFRICHNNGVVFADYHSLSSVKLGGG